MAHVKYIYISPQMIVFFSLDKGMYNDILYENEHPKEYNTVLD